MANPNILTATSVVGGRYSTGPLSSTIANLLTNGVSGHVYRVLGIRITNYDNSNSQSVSLAVGTGSVSLGAGKTFLHQKVLTGATSLQVLDDPIYLLEGESIAGNTASGGFVNILITYEDIS
tara:strand:- start:220 stop:585 length:366 start_codon:yes stop_codon:yes gene_type:complete